jgi:hypothetical protein
MSLHVLLPASVELSIQRVRETKTPDTERKPNSAVGQSGYDL